MDKRLAKHLPMHRNYILLCWNYAQCLPNIISWHYSQCFWPSIMSQIMRAQSVQANVDVIDNILPSSFSDSANSIPLVDDFLHTYFLVYA